MPDPTIADRIVVVMTADVRQVSKKLDELKRVRAKGEKTGREKRRGSLGGVGRQAGRRAIGAGLGVASRVGATAAAAVLSKDMIGAIIQLATEEFTRAFAPELAKIDKVAASVGLELGDKALGLELREGVRTIRREIDDGLAKISAGFTAAAATGKLLKSAAQGGVFEGVSSVALEQGFFEFGSALLDSAETSSRSRDTSDKVVKGLQRKLLKALNIRGGR